jgi:D-galactarolactone isomerase
MTITRTYSGAKPKTRLPVGATDTQIHMYLPGYPALPGGPPLPDGLPGPDDYRKVMNWLGLDRVVVTQGNSHQKDNANLVACLEAMAGCARGVAVIDSQTSDEDMARLHRAGVRGARIMDLPGGAVGLSELAAVDAKAHAHGWCVAVQFDGSDLLEHMPLLKSLKSRFILDHHGKFFGPGMPGPAEISALKVLIERGNCWFKFAGCYESSKTGAPTYEDIGEVARELAAFAPERIVWGTNWPHNLVKVSKDYPDDAALLDLVLSWVGDEKHLETVLVRSPAALFDF